MRRILKMLARLYPAAWRERYGAEYEALIEDSEPKVWDGFDVLWTAVKMRLTGPSFVRIVLPCALLGGLAAWGLSFSRPPLYRSRTLVIVDTDDQRSIDKQLQGLVEESLAQPYLVSIIQKENLYPIERTRIPLNDVVNLMRKNIWIRALQKSGGHSAPGFVFEFSYPDPHVAQRVDAELVSGLMSANLRAAIKSRASAARTPMTFSVPFPADLPQKPFIPQRGLFGAGGLLVGLVGGLIVAIAAGRRGPTVVNG